MSLINDALKRAKETHQQNPRPTTPPDAPALVAAHSSRSGTPAWIWFAIIFLLVGIGAFLIGQSMHKGGTPNSVGAVAARFSTEQPVTATAAIRDPSPAPTATATTPAASPVTVESGKGAIVPTPQTNTTDVVAVAAAPVPAPLKLQSIIYDPKHPSAMINGKLLFPGDSFGDLRVQEIRRNGVTLVGAGKTNVLSLE